MSSEKENNDEPSIEEGNLSDFNMVMDGIYDPPTTNQYREVTFDALRRELAIHEASHFVFNSMLIKTVPGFTVIDTMVMCLEAAFLNEKDKTDHINNRVQGMIPDVSEAKTYRRSYSRDDPSAYVEFFESDRTRLSSVLLGKAAGYASYKVFIDTAPNEFYIGGEATKIDGKNEARVQYWRIENGIATDDFNYIHNKLRQYYGLNPSERNEACIKIVKECQQLMMVQAVNDSIRFVARKLLNHECVRIDCLPLLRIIREVQRMTNKVQLQPILGRLAY
jgi:hypothetical protein